MANQFNVLDHAPGAIKKFAGIVTAGYFFGSVPFVKQHLDKIIWAIILIPGILVLWGAWKGRAKAAAARG